MLLINSNKRLTLILHLKVGTELKTHKRTDIRIAKCKLELTLVPFVPGSPGSPVSPCRGKEIALFWLGTTI